MRIGWLCSTVLATVGITLAPQQPQFRSAVTAVIVPVTVERRFFPIRDLAITDFTLTDSGIPQQITAIKSREVGIDITLVAERTVWIEYKQRGTYEKQWREVRKLLTPRDRVRVIGSGDEITEILPFGAEPEAIELRHANDVCSPLFDAVASAMMRATDPERRHIILAIAEDAGEGSVTTDQTLIELARRTNGQFHFVFTPRPYPRTVTRSWAINPRCTRAHADWSAGHRKRLRQIDGMIEVAREQEPALLGLERDTFTRVATITGGRELRTSIFSTSVASQVRDVLDEVRSSYILYYTPTGVPERGWHPIEVRINRPGDFKVRARAGYSR